MESAMLLSADVAVGAAVAGAYAAYRLALAGTFLSVLASLVVAAVGAATAASAAWFCRLMYELLKETER